MTGCIQTTGPVVFDYVYFQKNFPDLARWVSPEQAQSYFNLASLYLDNTDNGVPGYIPGYGHVGCRAVGNQVRDIATRQNLMGILMAHIATLLAPIGGEASSGLVGRISSATEGSVSVSVSLPEIAGAEWFSQTKWGLLFWQATAAYRTARYIPGPRMMCRPSYAWRRW